MNILWVEDFDGKLPPGTETLESMFKGLNDDGRLNFLDDWNEDELNLIERPTDLEKFCKDQKSLHTIYLCRNYFDYVAFKENHVISNEIDIIVLDIRLDNSKHVNFSYPIPNGYNDTAKFHQKAGFYIFNDLIHLGIPKEYICFMTGEDSTFSDFEKSRIEAYAPEVNCFEKRDTKGYEKLRDWIKEQESDYVKLRRGIIEGCNHLKTLTENELRFNDFISESEKKISFFDVADYVGVLESFLPLQEPKNKERFYKLFVRILVHEWEDSAKPKKLNNESETLAFSWIMKMSRNWSAHTKIFEQLTAQDVAYLFIVNMRAMFDLGCDLLAYEKNLLSLFTDEISAEEMREKNGREFKDRKIPLVENYARLLKKTGNTWQAINFHDALNNLQKNTDKATESEFLIKGLYQTFWFLTSSGGVYIPPNEEQMKKFSALNYQFKYFDYQKTDYLFELARHIYHRSFSQG